jgi:hypothetical protein
LFFVRKALCAFLLDKPVFARLADDLQLGRDKFATRLSNVHKENLAVHLSWNSDMVIKRSKDTLLQFTIEKG